MALSLSELPDRAVDQCSRPAAFPAELSRLEFLFEHYRQRTAPLPAAAAAAPKGRCNAADTSSAF